MLDLKVARTMVYNMDLYFDFYLQIYALINYKEYICCKVDKIYYCFSWLKNI